MPGTPIKCERCGDVISSSHRHDFVTCSCGGVSVDGGTDYLKVCWDAEAGVGWHAIGSSDLLDEVTVKRGPMTPNQVRAMEGVE